MCIRDRVSTQSTWGYYFFQSSLQILQEVSKDPRLEHIRSSYEALHNAFLNSVENEKKLLMKSQDDENRITLLALENERLIRLLELSNEREQRNKEKVELLHDEIRYLQSKPGNK
eukprot:TRINITY_DN9708_c0_g1_i5.p1 TRINITY_DN9708_c0_g1~~TRINITY_DN9708_c0_g1_i5.p1  ORF type:complete len:115 (-),score=14.76 TRINITY_DN9708_c0_g1_i5:32-376(-)